MHLQGLITSMTHDTALPICMTHSPGTQCPNQTVKVNPTKPQNLKITQHHPYRMKFGHLHDLSANLAHSSWNPTLILQTKTPHILPKIPDNTHEIEFRRKSIQCHFFTLISLRFYSGSIIIQGS